MATRKTPLVQLCVIVDRVDTSHHLRTILPGYDWTASELAETAIISATESYVLNELDDNAYTVYYVIRVQRLRSSMLALPLSSSLIAMMLSPAFVWGCESRTSELRELVVT